jgi:hypothetical protein
MLTSGLFLLVFGSCFSIMLTVAYASLGPTPQERFITLSTTGSDMTTRSLYPATTPRVGQDDTLNWNVQAANHMGESEYIAIRVKLLNATQLAPDEVRHLPSPADYIYEERLVLADGATSVTPLAITLKDVQVFRDSSAQMRALTINGKEIDGLKVSNFNSNSFRFVIELWRYDVGLENFVYTWSSGLESESAWNQIRIALK